MANSTQPLKAALPPERYYSEHLKGVLGKSSGRSWHLWDGLCPFHDDRRPGSFVVNKDSGAFRCFSCGEHGGDIIAFHMKANHMGFKEALNHLQEIVQCARS